MIPYEPRYLFRPSRLLDVPTAWNGIESILHDLISRFCPAATTALEIGVDYGYSTVALANFFPVVVGADTFDGDVHAGRRDDGMFERVRKSMEPWPNIRLVKADYKTFFTQYRYPLFDLAHVDIVHTYEATFECGDFAVRNSHCTIFHDTRSFPDVMRAVSDLAEKHGRTFHEWPKCHGLGILV